MQDFSDQVEKLRAEIASFNATQQLGNQSSKTYTLRSSQAWDFSGYLQDIYGGAGSGMFVYPTIVFQVTPIFDGDIKDTEYIPTQIYVEKGDYRGYDLTSPLYTFYGHRDFGRYAAGLSSHRNWFRDVTDNDEAHIYSYYANNLTRYYMLNGMEGQVIDYYNSPGWGGRAQIKFAATATAPGRLEVRAGIPALADWEILAW